MQHPEISSVTWSAMEIRVVYTDAMVVHLSPEDIYPLGVKAEIVSHLTSENELVTALPIQSPTCRGWQLRVKLALEYAHKHGL